jgi:hypothetical protein
VWRSSRLPERHTFSNGGAAAATPFLCVSVSRTGGTAMESLQELLPFLVPIALLEIALLVIALVDLVRRERTRGPKWVWAIVIVVVNIFGPIAYLLFGRED